MKYVYVIEEGLNKVLVLKVIKVDEQCFLSHSQ